MKFKATVRVTGSGITDSHIPNVVCDKCGQPARKTLGELKAVPVFACACGRELNATKVVKGLLELQKLDRAFGKMPEGTIGRG